MASHNPLKLNSKYILPLAMLYITASIAADVVAYKFIGIGREIIESGATIIFPLTYLFSEIITEIYGYSTARIIIWLGLGCELLFALAIQGILKLPSAYFWHNQIYYNIVLGSTLRFVVSGIIADVCSSFVNIYVISKWKIFINGRNFWLRSIGATAISELTLVLIIILLAFTGKMPFITVLQVMLSAYGLELLYAIIFVWPAWGLVVFLKRSEGIDAYDHNTNYNPFKFIN